MEKEKLKPNTSLRLHPDLKKASKDYAESIGVIGGLSGLITNLLRETLSKNKINWK